MAEENQTLETEEKVVQEEAQEAKVEEAPAEEAEDIA